MKKVRTFYLVILAIFSSILGMLIYAAYFKQTPKFSEEDDLKFQHWELNCKINKAIQDKLDTNIEQAQEASSREEHLKAAILYIHAASSSEALNKNDSSKISDKLNAMMTSRLETMALLELSMAKSKGQYNGEFNYKAFLDAKNKILKKKTPTNCQHGD